MHCIGLKQVGFVSASTALLICNKNVLFHCRCIVATVMNDKEEQWQRMTACARAAGLYYDSWSE